MDKKLLLVVVLKKKSQIRRSEDKDCIECRIKNYFCPGYETPEKAGAGLGKLINELKEKKKISNFRISFLKEAIIYINKGGGAELNNTLNTEEISFFFEGFKKVYSPMS